MRTHAHGLSKHPERPTFAQMQAKLSDFKAENHLLGKCVDDLKAERDRLAGKLAAVERSSSGARVQAQQASTLAEQQILERARLQREVDRLGASAHSSAVRLEK